jgi:hypothetical protein
MLVAATNFKLLILVDLGAPIAASSIGYDAKKLSSRSPSLSLRYGEDLCPTIGKEPTRQKTLSTGACTADPFKSDHVYNNNGGSLSESAHI